jgi:thiamine biosynthesis lipoprotein
MAKKLDTGLVLRVDQDGRIEVTAALHQRLQFIGQSPALSVVP